MVGPGYRKPKPPKKKKPHKLAESTSGLHGPPIGAIVGTPDMMPKSWKRPSMPEYRPSGKMKLQLATHGKSTKTRRYT